MKVTIPKRKQFFKKGLKTFLASANKWMFAAFFSHQSLFFKVLSLGLQVDKGPSTKLHLTYFNRLLLGIASMRWSKLTPPPPNLRAQEGLSRRTDQIPVLRV